MSDDPLALDGPPILFLDLDGTVRHGKDQLGHFVNGPDDVVVFPAALTMMHRWRDLGGLIVGVTNQAGLALGYFDLDTMNATNEETDRQADDLFDLIRVCGHAPGAGCWCRKPLPGMILVSVAMLAAEYGPTARERCLMVGDRGEDEAAARAAGVPFEWADYWRARAGEPA